MQASDQGFEQIMSAVLEQKQLWERLQTENRELHQQLLDLRAGRGIFVEILGQRFELAIEGATPIASETPEISQGKRSRTSKTAKETARPASTAAAGILEEMLLDELSSAMNNRMGPDEKPSTPLNEEQKAALRRELSGSFLLE